MTSSIKPGFYSVLWASPDVEPSLVTPENSGLIERLTLSHGTIFLITGETERVKPASLDYLTLHSVYKPGHPLRFWGPSGQDKLITPRTAESQLLMLPDGEARERLDHCLTRRYLKREIKERLKL